MSIVERLRTEGKRCQAEDFANGWAFRERDYLEFEAADHIDQQSAKIAELVGALAEAVKHLQKMHDDMLDDGSAANDGWWIRVHHFLARKALSVTEAEIRKLRCALSDKLNAHLSEMKPGYDDSITGFNEAWDVMGEFFDAQVALCQKRKLALAGLEAREREMRENEATNDSILIMSGITPSDPGREASMTPEKAVDQFIDGFSRDYRAALEASQMPPSSAVSELVEWEKAIGTPGHDAASSIERLMTAGCKLAADLTAAQARIAELTEALPRLVDLTWGRACEDGSVPSTKIANELIAVALSGDST